MTDPLSFILKLIQVVVYGAITLVVCAVGLAIVVSVMPRDNPLRMFLASLLKPVGTMTAIAVVGVPIEFIPLVDVVYDIVGLILIGRAWMQFFQDVPALWPQLMAYAGQFMAGTGTAQGAVPPATECFSRAQAALQREDHAEALRWFRLAAEQGHARAREILEKAEAHHEEARNKQQQEQGQQRQQDEEQPWTRTGRMTRAEALEILELQEGATPGAINAAWKRLMNQVHPDKGGSTFFAKQLNAAREVLLG